MRVLWTNVYFLLLRLTGWNESVSLDYWAVLCYLESKFIWSWPKNNDTSILWSSNPMFLRDARHRGIWKRTACLSQKQCLNRQTRQEKKKKTTMTAQPGSAAHQCGHMWVGYSNTFKIHPYPLVRANANDARWHLKAAIGVSSEFRFN